MLSYLAVKNVSVIESVSLEFGPGLTVLTGETGSGKSVFLGALKLLLGDRFQKTMLREGADRLMVEGIFSDMGHIPSELREPFEIDDEIIIRREADEAGKNRIFINGRAATVTQLKEFAPYLADIHGQHEHQALLDESRHISIVDHMVENGIKNAYVQSYSKYREKKAELEHVRKELEDTSKYREMLLFQLSEIEHADVKPAEDILLDEKIAFLSHMEKIQEACAASLEALTDGEINALSLVVKALKSLESLEKILPDIAIQVALLHGVSENINEVSRGLSALFDRQEATGDELDTLMRRKYMISDLIKKYATGLTGEQALEKLFIAGSQIRERLENLDNSTDLLNKLDKECGALHADALKKADVLLEARKAAASTIASQVQTVLGELELPGSIFLAKFFSKDSLDMQGGVDCRFYISVNAGFEPAPLAQVASGGEISRVMLALKEVFSESDQVQTLFFDEVDTGISGKTAKKVAAKLAALGKSKQIMVITHLPVVAAAGLEHFYISKSAASGTAKTSIVKLGSNDRVNAIASMISGEATASSIEQAKELISNNY